MNKLRIVTSVLLTSLLLIAGACVNVKQMPPDKRYYALNVTRVSEPVSNSSGKVLRIKSFRVSPLYADKGFVYKNGELEFLSDFYNEFLISPGPMVTAEAVKWLQNSGLFKTVLDTPSHVLPEYILEGAVSSLYGDFRDLNNPKAVMEIQFFLIAANHPQNDIVTQGQFRKELNIEAASAAALIKGWNQALQSIMTDFENMLIAKNL